MAGSPLRDYEILVDLLKYKIEYLDGPQDFYGRPIEGSHIPLGWILQALMPDDLDTLINAMERASNLDDGASFSFELCLRHQDEGYVRSRITVSPAVRSANGLVKVLFGRVQWLERVANAKPEERSKAES